MVYDKEIEALIKLLDDPDRDVYQMVSSRLAVRGQEIIPRLERAWEETHDILSQQRLEDIIQDIQFKNVLEGFSIWIDSGSDSLLEGAYWIAKYQYPDLELKQLEDEMGKITRDVWLELNNNLTALEKVRIINHLLFEVYKFSLNRTNIHAPQNSYINLVFEGKKTNAVSMAIVYLCLTWELNLPVFAIKFPKTILLGFHDEYIPQDKLAEKPENYLFFLNPLNRGAVFGKKELDYYMQQSKIEPSEVFFHKASNAELIQKMLSTLIADYERSGFTDKVKDLNTLLSCFKSLDKK